MKAEYPGNGTRQLRNGSGSIVLAQRASGGLRAVCAALLCLMLAVVPILLTTSHGPGAFVDAARAEAAVALHGHAHEQEGTGLGGHNAADHDHGNQANVSAGHRSFEMVLRKIDLRPADLRAGGLEGGGLRRPPRAAVL